MHRFVSRLLLASSLALAVVAGAHAQDKRSQTVLPVLDSSGKVEAFLVLEPAAATPASGRWRFGETQFDAAFGLEAGRSLALLCSPGSSFNGAVASLARNCQLASLGGASPVPGRRAGASAAFTRPGGTAGLSLGGGRDTVPALVTPARVVSGGTVDVRDLTVFAQKNIGDDAYVSLAGTLAKATLIPSAAAPATLNDQWSSRSLSVGGGVGRFSASIVGQVVDTPGLPKWEGLGLGVSWRTPWSGQLTVGADNVVTRGRNPFSKMAEATEDEGAVPYIRYQQDL
ncbi:hypothetical protein [Luteimonas deserti]|uniref:Secreted protein n=1 Tax=Luteimonas deserti TaxID=2752306 RepID=A0A7Z0TZQ8_9GAMM|nr:hypothetical protein [Luteimonas deserti]NYZ62498.1 hypothetical protein [Luteimonas deserti]